MITRRDNLLNRPWLEKRYENHRRKVQTALPAIDNRPPPSRTHVTMKQKKYQREAERSKKIEHENLLLLRKLNYTMRTNRVDNHWTTPPPDFLSRIPMYDTVVPRIEDIDTDLRSDKSLPSATRRKAKCFACTPQKTDDVKTPEERIPWEPQKPPMRRTRSTSVPVHKTESLPIIKEEKSDTSNQSPASTIQRPKTSLPLTTKKHKKKTRESDFEIVSPQSIILSRGCLKLAVNFPSDTFVKFQSGSNEKVLMQGLCSCNKRTSYAY